MLNIKQVINIATLLLGGTLAIFWFAAFGLEGLDFFLHPAVIGFVFLLAAQLLFAQNSAANQTNTAPFLYQLEAGCLTGLALALTYFSIKFSGTHTSLPVLALMKWSLPFVLLALSIWLFRQMRSNLAARRKALVWSTILSAIVLTGLYKGGHFSHYHPLVHLLFALSTFVWLITLLQFLFNGFKSELLAPMGMATCLLFGTFSFSQHQAFTQSLYVDLESLGDEFSNESQQIIIEDDSTRVGDFFILFRQDSTSGEPVFQYFEKNEKWYHPGDIVRYHDWLFLCLKEHVSSDDFSELMFDNWSEIPHPNARQIKVAVPWSGGRPGNMLFELRPTSNEGPWKSAQKNLLFDVLLIRTCPLPLPPEEYDELGYSSGYKVRVRAGEKLNFSNTEVFVDSVSMREHAGHPTQILGVITVTKNGNARTFRLSFDNSRQDSTYLADEDVGFKFALNKVNVREGWMEWVVFEHRSNKKEIAVVQLDCYPLIVGFWSGAFLWILGAAMRTFSPTKRISSHE